MSDDDPPTEELILRQAQRERSELVEAAEASTAEEEAAHLRRADKASYLEEKLRERERSEADAREDDSAGDTP
jgi:hypothetical protein